MEWLRKSITNLFRKKKITAFQKNGPVGVLYIAKVVLTVKQFLILLLLSYLFLNHSNYVQFVSIRGGFSNSLYRCSLPENIASGDPQVPKEVLLRIYGPIQEDPNLLVAGAVSFMLLSERRLGPKLYGLLPDGRLEEFIPVSSMILL